MIFLLSQEKIRSQWSVGNDNKKSFLEIVQSDFTSSSSLLHVPPVTPLCLSGGGAALKHRKEGEEKLTLASIEIPTCTQNTLCRVAFKPCFMHAVDNGKQVLFNFK